MMSVTPTKKEVAAAIVRAGTPEEINAARELREAYLCANPGDTDIQEMGETLDLVEGVLKDVERRTAEANTPPKN